jgi:hypothetical protein
MGRLGTKDNEARSYLDFVDILRRTVAENCVSRRPFG